VKNYTPNPIIIDRAVELWKRALGAPKYQNERPGEETLPLASMLASMTPKNNTPDVLEAFGAALKASLLVEDPENGWYGKTYLRVDYDPDRTLAAAANTAGLEMTFPWKTTMHIDEDKVSFSIGYGAPDQHHYPLPDGRWLVTTLRGDEMPKIIERVAAGVDLGLTIEG
jgi:hypothetical protein